MAEKIRRSYKDKAKAKLSIVFSQGNLTPDSPPPLSKPQPAAPHKSAFQTPQKSFFQAQLPGRSSLNVHFQSKIQHKVKTICASFDVPKVCLGASMQKRASNKKTNQTKNRNSLVKTERK
jgi:hypothetical protein